MQEPKITKIFLNLVYLNDKITRFLFPEKRENMSISRENKSYLFLEIRDKIEYLESSILVLD